jgi:hypothetical protein
VAFGKWASILRWAIGLEVWVKELERKSRGPVTSVAV